jgi:ribosomal protein L29
MKKQDKQSLHEKSLEQLQKELVDISSQLAKISLEGSVKPQKNTRVKRGMRTDIARLKTVMTGIMMKKKEPTV